MASGGSGFKACDACGDVFNEIITNVDTFWGGRLDGASTKTGVDVLSAMSNGGGGWTRKKGRKDVVAVVTGGGERGVL